MAYIPPLNGGRINASIGGNTGGNSSAGAVSTGTLVFSGGNNITLSQTTGANGITLGINAASGGGLSAGISGSVGNTSGTTGFATNQLVFAGGNNIVLSQATGAGGNTLTISASSQSNQTAGLYAVGNTTQNSSTTLDVRSLSFNGMGGLSAGYSNGSIELSAPSISGVAATGIVSISTNGSTVSIGAPAFSIGISSGIGNTSGNSGTASNQLILAGGNNITLSQATGVGGNTVSIIGASGGGGGIALANTSTTLGTTGTILFNDAAGAITIGGSGQTMNFSVPATSSVMGTNGITISSSAGSVSIGVNMVDVGITSGGNNLGATGLNTNGLALYGGSNITLSQATNSNGATVSIIGGSGGGGGGGGGIALANSQSNPITSGTAYLNDAAGAITISTAGQSFNFSVPATSSLVGTNGIGISTSGGTISIDGAALSGGGHTLSRWEYPEDIFASLAANGQGSLSIQHMYIPFNVTGTAMKIGGSISAATNTSATTASVNLSLWMGLYTLTGSTLSLMSYGSANNGFRWSQSASTTGNTSVQSMRQLTVPINVNITPGEYWAAAVISSATTYTSVGFTVYGDNLINSVATGAVLSPIGSNTSAARDAILFEGIYGTATSTGPATIVGSQINNTSASNVMRANFYNVIFNATY